jgi:hypothetical protein
MNQNLLSMPLDNEKEAGSFAMNPAEIRLKQLF